jgi:hypothetical protein
MTSTVQTGTPERTNPLECVPAPVSRQAVIERILAEVPTVQRRTGLRRGSKVTVTTELASRTIDWINGFVEQCRAADYQTIYPTDVQMATLEYLVFDAIMPHGTVAQSGSAADLVGRFLLDPKRDETDLLHDALDEPHSPTYCTVRIALGVLR